jgi:hypothetical protein
MHRHQQLSLTVTVPLRIISNAHRKTVEANGHDPPINHGYSANFCRRVFRKRRGLRCDTHEICVPAGGCF